MADDWQVGDLALCVGRGGNNTPYGPKSGHEKPRRGGIYLVEGVYFDGWGNLGLVLEGCHSNHPRYPAWQASCFRKIRPHDADAEDRETISLLTGKPARVPA